MCVCVCSAKQNDGVEEMYVDLIKYAMDGVFPAFYHRTKNIKRAR